MKDDLLQALGRRPSPLCVESEWEKTQRIKRMVCDRIPEQVDSTERAAEEWTELMSLASNKAVNDAADQILAAFQEIGVECDVVRKGGWVFLFVKTEQFRAAAVRERVKSDEVFLDRMRNR